MSINRRQLLTSVSALAVLAIVPAQAGAPLLQAPPTQLIDIDAAAWKRDFIAEFQKYVDWKSAPNAQELFGWFEAEADGAWNGLHPDECAKADPADEAREAAYAIGCFQ